MNRRLFLLLLASCMLVKAKAQSNSTESPEKKKKRATQAAANPSFKAVPGRKVYQTRQGTQINKPASVTPLANEPKSFQGYAGVVKQTATVEQPVLVNYNKLSPEVKRKFDNNKSTGKPRFDGIGRRFDISIPIVQSARDLSQKLSFLSGKAGVIKTGYLSPGMVYILTNPSLSSESLKEMLSKEGIDFDFQKEEFQLIQ